MGPAGVLLALMAGLVAGQSGLSSGKTQNGLIGYGIRLYEPACAHACWDTIAYMTNCTADMSISRFLNPGIAGPLKHGNEKNETELEPYCNAEYEPYLQTLAWCIHQECRDVPELELESFWWTEGPGKDNSSIETYSQIWARVNSTKMRPINQHATLNYTATVPHDQWKPSYDNIITLVRVEITHERYALILFLSCALIPIGLSLLRFLPWSATYVSHFHAYIIDPPLIGHRQNELLGEVFMMPTRGQAIFIAYIWTINIVLSGTGYWFLPGSYWYNNDVHQTLTQVSNRLGMLSFANIPLLILFAGRNNILLWLTNWPRTTFLMMHRWIAVICMLEGVLHTVLFFYAYSVSWYAMTMSVLVTKGYWLWGAVGTIGLMVLVVTAVQPIRRRAYELFVFVHIVVSALVLAGCYQHVVLRYGRQRGFETWMYVAVAIWGFDRAVRLMRACRRGVRKAYISPVDSDYMRVDIPGVSARGHVYLHFPTISKWRVWESHPFSVAGSSCYNTNKYGYGPQELDKPSWPLGWDPLATPPHMSTSAALPLPPRKTGVTLFIKKQKGLTAKLGALNTGDVGIPVMMEGSYNEEVTFLQENHLQPTPDYQNIICFAGGVGITGVLPFLDKFGGLTSHGSKRLFWTVRSMPLVYAVEDMLGAYAGAQGSERRWGDVDVSVSFGRFSVSSALREHLDSVSGGSIVVVCGPAGLADQVRMLVTRLAASPERKTKPLKLVVESFAW
ncbi:ferric-chelate reductase (Fre2) [Beauveria bassiana ARSEF 2860]|uniref:Ferric-chelate reductase (Fre2) n=1 Tax=Beauveria bassiana (strain ARSEF 2860) TaxID=655819 RepID=J4WJW3_BEAB2|nr:ferric-chelate reductase (Fre2) [Beauveria bassiana ARSEF 2860]EJP70090.1 ferric-chelate reductase (Fre2) [Beauveria bassiana ARSEF 2860]